MVVSPVTTVNVVPAAQRSCSANCSPVPKATRRGHGARKTLHGLRRLRGHDDDDDDDDVILAPSSNVTTYFPAYLYYMRVSDSIDRLR